jgi:hypothetical protein
VTSDLIMIDIIDNCLHDNITLNSTPRADNDLVEYSTIDSYPILKINEDIQNYTVAGSNIKVNLTEQFLQTADPKYCGFSGLVIDRVVD